MSIFLRAYSLGGGTYTGIEAVSNGMQILREPKVRNGKKTMAYMASSLAITAGGLLVCYLLVRISPEKGRTLNATLADALYGGLGRDRQDPRPRNDTLGGRPPLRRRPGRLHRRAAGHGQHGGRFLDAPALRRLLRAPHDAQRHRDHRRRRDRHARLHEGLHLRPRRHVLDQRLPHLLPLRVRDDEALHQGSARPRRIKPHSIVIQAAGFVLCALILCLTVYEKFLDGGWLTVLITGFLIAACIGTRRHYRGVKEALRSLDSLVPAAEMEPRRSSPRKKDASAMTAIQLVSGYNGMGVHSFLQIKPRSRASTGISSSPRWPSSNQELFKTGESVAELAAEVDASLARYVDLARRYGFWSEAHSAIGTNVQDTASELCSALSYDYPHSTVFSGNLIFSRDRFIYRILHNEIGLRHPEAPPVGGDHERRVADQGEVKSLGERYY